jgi:hypothetical protein
MTTELRFFPADFLPEDHTKPVFSMKECTQSLTIKNPTEERLDIFGNSVYLGLYKKQPRYESVITGHESIDPLFQHLKNGGIFWVACITPLQTESFIESQSIVCGCKPVKNSLLWVENPLAPGKILKEDEVTIEDNTLYWEEKRSGFITYRPLLKMRLEEYSVQRKEWEQSTQWKLILSEVLEEKKENEQ